MLFAFAVLSKAQYYDFTVTAPSGQTLYCSISGNTVTLVNPFSTEGRQGSNHVSGDLIIPDSVQQIVQKDSIDYILDSTIQYLDTITYAVTSMYYSVFRYCDSLTSVVIPNTITNIPYCAFGDCTRLTSVIIGNSVNSIGAWAFSACFALQSIYIPETVTSIGNGAFNAVRHIEYYGNADGAPWGAVSMNGYKDGDFVYTDSNKNNMIAYIGAGGNAVVPESVDTIGYGAFCVCRDLTSVVIPESVKRIESSAFYSCTNLAMLTFHGTEAPTLGDNCFTENSSNRVFNIPCGSYSSYSNIWADAKLIAALQEPQVNFEIKVDSSDPQQGDAFIVLQNGREIACDSTVIIQATSNDGYRFDHWSNGSTANPDTLHLKNDCTITAVFSEIMGIDDVVASNIDIHSEAHHIIIKGIEGQSVSVYCADGRLLFHAANAQEEVSLPTNGAGIYFVKVNNARCRKVVLRE